MVDPIDRLRGQGRRKSHSVDPRELRMTVRAVLPWDVSIISLFVFMVMFGMWHLS